MLPVTLDDVRLFLHVLAATIWVGGQITLTGLLPVVREAGPPLPTQVARAFNRLAWPAFAVLWVTGLWNVHAVAPTFGNPYTTTLMVKILVVVVAGFSAAAHALTHSRTALALFGALAGLSSLVALFLGVQLG